MVLDTHKMQRRPNTTRQTVTMLQHYSSENSTGEQRSDMSAQKGLLSITALMP